MSDYFQEKWGIPRPGTSLHKKEEPKNKEKNIPFPILIVQFILQLFLLGPDRRSQNPIQVILMGLVMFVFNCFLIFNVHIVQDFVEMIFSHEGTQSLVAGFIAIVLIFQALRSVFIIGGWNQEYSDVKYDFVPGSRPAPTGYYDTFKQNVSTSNSNSNSNNSEFNTVHNLMNQHMAQLTNSQKIKYMKDFYGGK